VDYKCFLDNGFSISKKNYCIAKYDNSRRYNKGHYVLERLCMGGWAKVGANKDWSDFVEYLKIETGDVFVGICGTLSEGKYE
jgi:hypothetical protein